MMHPWDILVVILELIFLAALGRYAWKNRANKFVFWGMVVVIVMVACFYAYFDWFPHNR